MYRGPASVFCNTVNVEVGRCQCARNCGMANFYNDVGEFLPEEGRCVGFVGTSCYDGWAQNDCVPNSYCPQNRRICECNLGFEVSSDGKHCVRSSATI